MSIPFALSLSKYVNSVGTDIGFASLLGVALLALLYFAGARESRTLHEQLEAAQERIVGLEARLAQTLRAQAGHAPAVGGPGDRPAGTPAATVGPMGSAVARVEREGAGTAGLAGATPDPSGAPIAGAGFAPLAAMGQAGPALGSATTTLAPTPSWSAPQPALPRTPEPRTVAATAGGSAPAYAAPVPRSLYDADEDDGYADDDTFGPDDTMFVPPADAGNGREGRDVPPPRAYPQPTFASSRADDGGSTGGSIPRRTIPTVATGRPRRRLPRLAGALVLLGILVVVVIVLAGATGSGRAPAPVRHVTVHRTTPTGAAPKAPLAVLNGTAVAHLAGDVATKLISDGYPVPAPVIADAAEQTDTVTQVGYLPGYRSEALAVAKALTRAAGVAVSQTAPATAAQLSSCATAASSKGAGTCPAKVIVTLGSDLAGVAGAGAGG